MGAVTLALLWGVAPRFRTGLRSLAEAVRKIRVYDALLRRVSDAEALVGELRADNAALRSELERAYEDGVDAGRGEVAGTIRAVIGPKITPIATSVSTGTLTVVGEYDEGTSAAQVGARYEVETVVTGERMGLLQIVNVLTEDRRVHLRPIDGDGGSEYWKALEERAATDPSPPAGVRLVAAKYSLPRAMQPLLPPADPLVSALLKGGTGK